MNNTFDFQTNSSRNRSTRSLGLCLGLRLGRRRHCRSSSSSGRRGRSRVRCGGSRRARGGGSGAGGGRGGLGATRPQLLRRRAGRRDHAVDRAWRRVGGDIVCAQRPMSCGAEAEGLGRAPSIGAEWSIIGPGSPGCGGRTYCISTWSGRASPSTLNCSAWRGATCSVHCGFCQRQAPSCRLK